MSAPEIDDDLLDLFRQESGEHIDALEQGLLQLEDEPGDQEALESVRRQAHSLKGSARMLGLAEVERLAHGFEDVLEAALEEGKLAPSRADSLYAGIDALREVTQAAIEDRDAEVEVDDVLAGIEPGAEQPQPASDVADDPAPDAAPPADAQGTDPAPEPTPEPGASSKPGEGDPAEEDQVEEGGDEEDDVGDPGDPLARARSHQIDTVRVDPEQLDALMRQAGELAVTTQRVQRLQERLRDVARRVAEARGSGSGHDEVRGDPVDELEDIVRRLQADGTRLDAVSDAIQEGVEEARLLPMSTIFTLFPRAVRDLAQGQDKDVRLELSGEEVRADKRVLEELKDPLMHLVRNAVSHGIEAPSEREDAGKPPEGRVELRATRTADSVVVEVEDDGRGIDPDRVRAKARQRGTIAEETLARMDEEALQRLVLDSGFSTQDDVTDVSGRGVGMDAVVDSVDQLDGSLRLSSTPGEATRVTIEVPVRLSTARVVLVEAGGQTYGVPMDRVDRLVRVDPEDVYPREGRRTVQIDEDPVPVGPLDEALQLGAGSEPSPHARPCLVLQEGPERFGVLVDELAGEQEVVVEPLGGVLDSVRHVAGGTVLDTGEVCVVLEPSDLSADLGRDPTLHERGPADEAAEDAAEAPGADDAATRLLLVEDTIMTRTQLKRILEGEGYEVVPAVDGADALAKLDGQAVDGVVSDIDMPKVDGLELTRELRDRPDTEDVPIILVTTRASDEDKREGMEAGANAYIRKGRFDQSQLVEAVGRLVG